MLTIIDKTAFKNFKGISGIYGIANTSHHSPYFPLGKVYIGQTTNIKPRLWQHWLTLTSKTPPKYVNIHLWRSFQKYGHEVFRFVLIEGCEAEKLNERETYWIEKTRSREIKFGYNKRIVSDSNAGIVYKPLNEEVVIEWILKYKDKYGTYPNQRSGKIEWSEIGDTWKAISLAYLTECRGLKNYNSLEDLILKKFGHKHCKDLSLEVIRKWCKEFKDKYGKFPTLIAGVVEGAEIDGYESGITWQALNLAMKKGSRGLEPGLYLSHFISQEFEITNRRFKPYELDYVKKWILEFCKLNVKTPSGCNSQIIEQAKKDGFGNVTWNGLNKWLMRKQSTTLFALSKQILNKLC